MRSTTNTFVSSLALVGSSIAAYVPGQVWSTLTPDATLSGATTDYSGTFGIAVIPLTSSSIAKRAAISQISDGQIQASTATPATTTAQPISQISDGQIQATTATVQPISQISDGQIQATTATTVQPISQISDGQIQATTATTVQPISQISDGQIQATTATTVQPISQISDGQIQATTATTVQPISQIGDGQIQATTATTQVVSQISDGQIQATSTATTGVASQISDGQIQATSTTNSTASATSTAASGAVACKVDGTLQMTLKKSILTDSDGRIGSIVANRQFQFDGPPPQAGAIYAAGWGIYDGNLAIGNTTTFYQCLSGTFYNLYDQTLGIHCTPVHLQITELIDC